MPVTLTLIEHDHIILSTFQDPLTLADVMGSVQQARQMRNSVKTHTLHSLMDFLRVQTVPMGALRARAAEAFTNPEHGNIAIVSDNPYVIGLLELLSKLSKKPVREFNTYDEALDYLRAIVANEDSQETSTV